MKRAQFAEALGETKTGPSLRPLGRSAFAVVDAQDPIADHVFPAGPDAEGYQGLPGLWRTVQKTARLAAEAAALGRGEPVPAVGPLDGVTLHSLRHSFAGVAEQLGATIPTIAALLGHRVGGVTGVISSSGSMCFWSTRRTVSLITSKN
jgi:integrase